MFHDGHSRAATHHVIGKKLAPDLGPGRQNYCAFHYILELPNIPGPRVGDQGPEAFRRDVARVAFVLLRIFVEEVLHQ